jgi:tetratricopeptide (TPR) repeat protein
MIKHFTIFLLAIPLVGLSKPNCNIYKMEGNQKCYEACLLATTGSSKQGTRESQIRFDNAITLCPNLEYAFVEKSVPYLKRGYYIEWKKIIDKAVKLNPIGQLGYRGWCRYQFLRDYLGAIDDFEKLDSMTQFDIGYSRNGDYHLNVVKALCYKALGENKRSIEIIEKQLSENGYSPMPYDYLHLGVLKFEIEDFDGAIQYFEKSILYNDYLAEPYYYLGLIYKKLNKRTEFIDNMQKAKKYYLKGYKIFDPYSDPIDKVYLADIENELI